MACARKGPGGEWRFFTAAEARTVGAIVEQLIPADDFPGAREAGVVNYIDLQLTRAFRRHQRPYRQGLAAIDAASRKKFGRAFAELDSGQQTEILQDAEENAAAFFDLILTHTRQGFYGDPRHGGNRDMASWKMVGIPFPPVRGREHYNSGSRG